MGMSFRYPLPAVNLPFACIPIYRRLCRILQRESLACTLFVADKKRSGGTRCEGVEVSGKQLCNA